MTIAAAARAWIAQNPKASDLTLRQLALLDLIATDGPQELRLVAHRLGLAKPVVTRACDRLFRYVERKTMHDKRRRVVMLTDAGRALVDAMRTAK